MDVLLIDDDKSILAMLKIHLTRAGFTVEAATSPEDGLALLAGRRFDWLVVDGQMDPLDGFAVAARARALRPELRVVMISGVYAPEDAEARGIERLFEKPFDPADLIAHLRTPRPDPAP